MKGQIFNRPVAGSVKKFVATTDRNNGESPKSAIVVPEARPIWLGNVLEAANREEKYLNINNLKKTRSYYIPKPTKTQYQGRLTGNRKRNDRRSFEREQEDC